MCSCFIFKQKTAYEMRISDWSSDVCSSDLYAEHTLVIREMNKGEFVEPPMAQRASNENEWFDRTVSSHVAGDRKSVVSGQSVSVRVDHGGRSIINKKKVTKCQCSRKQVSYKHTDYHHDTNGTTSTEQ